MRCWLATPDWVFRAIGAGLILAFIASRAGEYRDFPRVEPAVQPVVGADAAGRPIYGAIIYFPLARVLVDLTFLLIAIAFIVRLPPRRRAGRPREIIIPLVAAVWPLTPILLLGLLTATHSDLTKHLSGLMSLHNHSYPRFYAGVTLMCIGNAFDLWGYGTLFRSISITAEARELKVTGPYQWVRHPIYLGQFIAQGGFWLVLVRFHWVWVVFYGLFVVMQLYRARIEEGVLEHTFGEPFTAWKRKTFWFLR